MPRKADLKNATLLEVCALASASAAGRDAAGVRDLPRAMRVASFVLEWAIAEAQVGHELDLAAFQDWWRISRASAFRRQQEFRELFGDKRSPSDFAAILRQALPDGFGRGVRTPLPGPAVEELTALASR